MRQKQIELDYKNGDATKIIVISADDIDTFLEKIINIFYAPFEPWIPYTGAIIYCQQQPCFRGETSTITYKEPSKPYIHKNDLESILVMLFENWRKCNYRYKIKIESDKKTYIDIILNGTNTFLDNITNVVSHVDDNLCLWTIKHDKFSTLELLINFKQGKELSSWYPHLLTTELPK